MSEVSRCFSPSNAPLVAEGRFHVQVFSEKKMIFIQKSSGIIRRTISPTHCTFHKNISNNLIVIFTSKDKEMISSFYVGAKYLKTFLKGKRYTNARVLELNVFLKSI